MEKKLDDFLKSFGDLTAYIDKAETTINKRMDEVEEKSKSVYTRIREALEPVPE